LSRPRQSKMTAGWAALGAALLIRAQSRRRSSVAPHVTVQPTYSLVTCRSTAESASCADNDVCYDGLRASAATFMVTASMLLFACSAFADDASTTGGGDWFEGFVSLNASIINGIDSTIGSAGIAILIYAILTKALTFPLNQISLRTTALMRIIGPQMTQIQKKYEKDEQTKNKMLLTLYKDVGVNPLSGIIPVLVQLPIFVGLYRAIGRLASQDDHFKEPFLWIPSLSGPAETGKPTLDWLFKSPYADHFEPMVGWHDAGLYLILPLVLVVTQLASAYVSNGNKKPDNVTLIFPLIVGFSTLVSPQGLGVYWFTNSVIGAIQTQYTRWQVEQEFPEYGRILEAVNTAPENVFKKGDKVTVSGKPGVIVYGPDTDDDVQVEFEDGSKTSYIKKFELNKPVELDSAVAAMAKEVKTSEAQPSSRKARRAAQSKQKQKRRK